MFWSLLLFIHYSLMSLFETIKKKLVQNQNKNVFLPIIKNDIKKDILTEAFKTKIEKNNNLLKKGLEEHPYDYAVLEEIYVKEPLINSAINKIVDFTIGPGFSIDSKNVTVSNLLNQFIIDHNFDNLLRHIARDLLLFGTSFVQLDIQKQTIKGIKTLNPKFMYVKRDEHGQILEFVQKDPQNSFKEPLSLSINEIIQFNNNSIGDRAYGCSRIQSLIYLLEIKRNIELDTAIILHRKAGAPLHVKVGDEKNRVTSAELSDFKTRFEAMKNNQEYVTSHAVEMNILGFEGKTIDTTKFLDYLMQQISFSIQIPEVLLGKGNVPEGLAGVQMDAFERGIISLQQNIEQVLENDLFKKVLLFNGLMANVEFSWESPSKKDRLAEAGQLASMMQLANTGLIKEKTLLDMESRMRELLGFPELELSQEEEHALPQPRIPGSNEAILEPDGFCLTESRIDEKFSVYDDVHLKEFVGFNYDKYLEKIESFINSPEFDHRKYESFEFLPGTQQEEWVKKIVAYKLTDNLSKEQVGKLKEVLIEHLRRGSSIRVISKNIRNKVKPGDLIVEIPSTPIRSAYSRVISERSRSLNLARVEIIRASNQGALKLYEEEGASQVRWIAAISDRTCSYCAEQNGKIFGLKEANDRIAAHVGCRCSWGAID